MDTGIPEHFCMAKTTDLWLKRSPESKVLTQKQVFFVLFWGFWGGFCGLFLFGWVFLIHRFIFLQ